MRRVCRLLKELLYDQQHTLSLGRCLAVWFAGIFSVYLSIPLVLVAYAINHQDFTSVAGFLKELMAPVAALAGGSFLASLAPYVITKVWTGGGTSGAQIDAEQPIQLPVTVATESDEVHA